VLIAGFDALELLERGEEGAARGVDAVLEAIEDVVAAFQSGGGHLAFGRAGLRELVPEGIFGVPEAAHLPLAIDELIDEEAGLGRLRRMALVVFVLQLLEVFLVFPDEDLSFREDAGLQVGVDDAGLAFGRDSSVGLAAVLAGGGDLLARAFLHMTFLKMKKDSPGGTALRPIL
jgi:hypothetical protein